MIKMIKLFRKSRIELMENKIIELEKDIEMFEGVHNTLGEIQRENNILKSNNNCLEAQNKELNRERTQKYTKLNQAYLDAHMEEHVKEISQLKTDKLDLYSEIEQLKKDIKDRNIELYEMSKRLKGVNK